MRKKYFSHNLQIKMVRGVAVGLAFVTALAVMPTALAQQDPDIIRARVEARGGSFFNFVGENDSFIGEDNGFTSGISFAYGRAGFDNFTSLNTPLWMRVLTSRLPFSTRQFKNRGISHQFIQRLQTPLDIEIAEFVPDDLPYAGLLAYQGSLFSSDTDDAEELSLILGLIGPSALGEQAQSELHAIIGSPDPKGWRFQIRDTPVFQIDYRRVRSVFRTNTRVQLGVPGLGRTQFEVLGLGNVSVGNLETSTELGVALRIGANLSRSITAFDLKANRQVNPLAFGGSGDWYGFVGARVGYVFEDIFVEGDLPDGIETEINLERLRTELAAGIAIGSGPYAFVVQFSADSVLIEEQTGFDAFVAVSLTYRY